VRKRRKTHMNLLGRFFPAHNRVYLHANHTAWLLDVWTGSFSQVRARGPWLNRQCRVCVPAFPHLAPFFRVHLYLGIIAESRLLGSLIFIHANYYGEKLCLNIELRVITPGYIVFRREIKAIGKEVKLREGSNYARAKIYNLIHGHACP
jgi:hypothetical protein